MTTFDTLAPTYDADFTQSPIARHLRARVHARLGRLCAASDHVLELGCGTGEDALYLARRDVNVVATDASEAMLAIARAKLVEYSHVRVEQLDLRALARSGSVGRNAIPIEPGQHSLVFANFGVLNCLDDWGPLAHWLAAILPLGGHAAFAVMPPACLWEMAWHGVHGEWGVASRRWRRGGAVFSIVPVLSSTQPSALGSQDSICYPSVRRLTRDFAHWFRRVHVEPLGLFLPPSDVYGVIERRPRLLQKLTRLDDGEVGRLPMLANFADHYWIEFQRK